MAQTEVRTASSGRPVPIFYDTTGRRWYWFRFYAIHVIAICVLGFLSVAIGSYKRVALPSLDLPYHQKLHAVRSAVPVIRAFE